MESRRELERLRTIVQELQHETVDLLQGLIRVPSENPPGHYIEIANFLSERCTHLGFDVRVVDADDVEVQQAGLTLPRRNVILTLKGLGEGRTLLLNAHLDTVPVGDEGGWTHAPFSGVIEHGRVYGRGATDSKGRLAAYIMAAVAVARLGIPRFGDIVIAATCDEETGGRFGAGYVVRNGLVKADIAIVEGYSNQIIRAMAGVLYLKLIVRGVSAHAGWKWKGVNAIEQSARVITALGALQRELQGEPSAVPGMRYTAINVGLIHGGTKTNVVPDHCVIDVECRVIPEHSLEYIRRRISTVIHQLQVVDETLVVELIWRPEEDIQPTVVDDSAPEIEELQNAIKESTGETVPVVGVLGQSDARWFIQHGIPAINYGPGTPENYVHHPDEHMDIEDLLKTVLTLAIFATRVVGDDSEVQGGDSRVRI